MGGGVGGGREGWAGGGVGFLGTEVVFPGYENVNSSQYQQYLVKMYC